MKREFNDTGVCVRNMHYMADTSRQMKDIFELLIEPGKYFTINRGRQFGKTTTISLIAEMLEKREDYLLIETSFEGIGDDVFRDVETFSRSFLSNLSRVTSRSNKEISEEFKKASTEMKDFETLSTFITNFTSNKAQKVVLIIDEVDKSTNNQLFLSFLGLLRDKYLLRNRGKDRSFHSVILAGVHDIKTIKLKIREGSEEKLNSPWNIAADFTIDLSFHPPQIESLLDDFLTEHPNVTIPKKEVAEKLYFYTSGYPFLVSKMCKIIDEIIIRNREDKNWTVDDVEDAFEKIVYSGYTTTLFDSIAKSIQNNEKLYTFIYELVVENKRKSFVANDTTVYLAKIYDIIRDENKRCKIHNRIFEQRIYDLMLSIMDNSGQFKNAPEHSNYFKGDDIDLEYIMLRFQQFFKENYSHTDKDFIEREGRLIFLSYLQPIINSKGYAFKEPVVGEDRRMDIAVTYNNKRYVIELKIWHGEKYHQTGLEQLSDYLDIYSLRKGYLLIFNFNKGKEFKDETIRFKDKELFTVWT